MPNDAKAAKGEPIAPTSFASACERMRAHRQRHKAGLRCVTIELRETEVTELIRRKLLDLMRVTTFTPFGRPFTST